MIIKNLIDEDFVNYKLPSMYIGFPKCNFKCEKECGKRVCQNGILATSKDINIDIDEVISRYMCNFITSAVVIAGLEPFDDFNDLYTFISAFREKVNDDIVIFTGYYDYEIANKVKKLIKFKNIIIKYGRYIPNQQPHYDDVLGVYLASDNQYAEKIS